MADDFRGKPDSGMNEYSETESEDLDNEVNDEVRANDVLLKHKGAGGQKQDEYDYLGSNPILKKLGRILTNSNANDWKQGGFEITPEARVPRPVQIHEFVYIRDLGERSLILKSSTPVNCQYAPGGYMLQPLTSGNFSIELRDKVFDPDKLVDPKFASNFKGKFHEVLASGEVARKLFEDVRELVRGNSRNYQREFEEKAMELYDSLIDLVEEGNVKNWEKTVNMQDGREITTYTNTYQHCELTSLRSIEGWSAYFEIKIKKDKFEISKVGGTPKLIFLAIEKQEQLNQLDDLEKKLKELGLEE